MLNIRLEYWKIGERLSAGRKKEAREWRKKYIHMVRIEIFFIR